MALPNKQTSMPYEPLTQKSGGILSGLWRKIVEDKNINNSVMELLIDKYLSSNLEVDSVNIKRRAKATLKSNLYSGGMTWFTFSDLLFRFLRVKKLTISIKITAPNGEESVHSVIVDNNMYEAGEEIKQEEKTDVDKRNNN